MISRIAAVPGQWYLDRENGGVFQIIGIGERDRSIEIQYVDGSLEASSSEDWTARRLEACEQPEDWVGFHSSDPPMERALLAIEKGRSLPLGDSED